MLPIVGFAPFPSDDVPDSKKETKDYGLQVARAIQFRAQTGGTLWSYADWKNFSILRAYGAGRQDTTALRGWYIGTQSGPSSPAAIPSRIDANGVDQFSPGTSSNDLVRGKRVFNPMNYEVESPMPKVISTITSLVLNEASYKIQCKSLNPAHVQKRNEEAWAAYYRATFGKQQAETLGVPFYPGKLVPKSEAQIEMMLKNGYFRLLFETGFQDLVQHTFDISDYDKWRVESIRDGINIGFKCGKRYTCLDTGKTKIKYIDPAKFVMQWNSDTEGKKPTFIGHVEKYPMYIVKKMMQKMGYSHDEIVAVARSSYNSAAPGVYSGWPEKMWVEKDPTGRWVWESMEDINVLEFEFVTQNEERYVKSETGFDKVLEPHHRYDKKLYKTCVYEGMYVVGTQALIKWEEAVNNDGEVSYFWDRIPGASITERTKPICDDIMKLIVKWRAEVWAASPSGYYVDLSAISNLALNPADQHEYIQQQIAAHRQSGILVGQSNLKGGKLVNDKPVIPMDNGPKNLDAYGIQIANKLNEVLDIAGIPQILAATPTQTTDKAVRVAEQEIISGGYAMFPQKESYWRFMEFAAIVALRQIRLDIRFDPAIKKAYEGIVGPEVMAAMVAVQDLSMDELAITLKALPTVKQKAELKQMMAEVAMSGTRDGLIKLTEADLLHVYDLIDDDQIEIAKMYAAMTIDERLADYEKKAPEAAAQNADLQVNTALAIEEEKRKTIQLDYDLKIKLMQATKQTPNIEIEQKNEAEKQQIMLEGMEEAATGKDIKNPRN